MKAIDNKGAIALQLSYKIPTKEAGLIPIGDVESFQKYLDRYNSSDEVTVSTTDNLIIITRVSPQKIARISKSSVDTITTTKGVEVLQNFQFNDKGFPESKKTKLNLRLTLEADEIKKVVDDGEVVKQRIYPWMVDNGFSIKVGTEQLGQIETLISLKKIEGEIPEQPSTKTVYAYGLDNIFGNIDGEIKVYLANGTQSCPMLLTKETEKYNLTILLAPATVEE